MARHCPGPWGWALGQWTQDPETGLATQTWHHPSAEFFPHFPWEKDVSQASHRFWTDGWGCKTERSLNSKFPFFLSKPQVLGLSAAIHPSKTRAGGAWGLEPASHVSILWISGKNSAYTPYQPQRQNSALNASFGLASKYPQRPISFYPFSELKVGFHWLILAAKAGLMEGLGLQTFLGKKGAPHFSQTAFVSKMGIRYMPLSLQWRIGKRQLTLHTGSVSSGALDTWIQKGAAATLCLPVVLKGVLSWVMLQMLAKVLQLLMQASTLWS